MLKIDSSPVIEVNPAACDGSAILNALPVAVYATDRDGRITFFNPAAEALAGRAPELGRDRWCVSWRLSEPDGAPLALEDCPMAVALKQGRPVRDVKIIAERPDGARVPVMPFPTPLLDESGALVGAVNVLVDISALKRAEDAERRRADEQAALYRFTDRLFRATNVSDVYEAALSAIVSALRCDRAAVLLFDDAGTMRFVASRGLSDAYQQAVEGHAPWSRDETDPKPVPVHDAAEGDFDDALKAVIRAEGIGACAFIPLMADGALVGKFMAYHNAPHTFADDEIELAVTLARQLGFSLERRRTEARLRESQGRLGESEARFRLIADSAPVMLWMGDATGKCVYLNRALRDFWGVSDESLDTFDWSGTLHPEDRHALFGPFSEAMRTKTAFSVEARYRRADGAYRILSTRAEPRFGPDGAFHGMIGVNNDVTDTLEAVRALSESEERFRAIVDTTPECVKLVAADGTLLYMNTSGLAMCDAETPSDVVGACVYGVIAQEDRERFKGFNEAVCAGHRGSLTFDIVGLSGRRRHMETYAAPFVNPADGTTVHLGVTRDVTARRHSEEQRTLLINELNHRVKNTLATVQSLAVQTMKSAPSADEAQRLLGARLAALSRAHDVLTLESWEGADLRDVVDRALAPFRLPAERGAERLLVSGPNVRLSPKQALAISMGLHELATNAAKYGALSGDAGRVALGWTVEGDIARKELRLVWAESGGPPVTPPKRLGFGARLLQRNLAHDLGAEATLDFRPEGLVAQMKSPMEARA